jgi:hypothetical protein
LLRQLFIVDLSLAFGGAAFGCLLAYGGIKALVALLPDGAMPGESLTELNPPVLAGSAAIAALTVIIFGLDEQIPVRRGQARSCVPGQC